MERNEALTYSNEIKDACDLLSPEDLPLIEIKKNIRYAAGWTILIRSFLNTVCKRQISSIAEKHGLVTEEKHEGFVVYEPHITKTNFRT